MKKALFLFFLILTISHVARADVVPEGTKHVNGYVRVEGWDVVGDDYLVILVPEWDQDGCERNEGYAKFSLLEDYKYYGTKPPIAESYGLGVIRKGDLKSLDADILIEGISARSLYFGSYAIPCDSDIYREAILSDKSLPSGFIELPEDSPVQRVDYMLTLKKLDFESKVFDYDVSDPIERTNIESAGAVSFVESLNDHMQSLEVTDKQMRLITNGYRGVCKCPEQNLGVVETCECPGQELDVTETYGYPVECTEPGLGVVWIVVSYVSLFLLGGIVSFGFLKLVERRKANKLQQSSS